MMRDKLPSPPSLAALLFAGCAAWEGLYELATFCVAGVFVLTFFDARQERAYRRAEGAGVSMWSNRAGDAVFDVIMSGLIGLACLVMLGVI